MSLSDRDLDRLLEEAGGVVERFDYLGRPTTYFHDNLCGILECDAMNTVQRLAVAIRELREDRELLDWWESHWCSVGRTGPTGPWDVQVYTGLGEWKRMTVGHRSVREALRAAREKDVSSD